MVALKRLVLGMMNAVQQTCCWATGQDVMSVRAVCLLMWTSFALLSSVFLSIMKYIAGTPCPLFVQSMITLTIDYTPRKLQLPKRQTNGF
jgi:hypothetical protein